MALVLLFAGSASWAEIPNQFGIQKKLGSEVEEFEIPGGCINRRSIYRLVQSVAERQGGTLRPYDLSIRLDWMCGCAGWIFFDYFPVPHFSIDMEKGLLASMGGRFLSTGERFAVSPERGFFEEYSRIDGEWTEKLRDKYLEFRKGQIARVKDKIIAEEKEKDPEYDPAKDPKFNQKLNALFGEEWKKVYPDEWYKDLTSEEIALDKEDNRVFKELDKKATSPDVGDWEYVSITKGVDIPVSVDSNELSFVSSAGEKTVNLTSLTDLAGVMAFRAAQIASGMWGGVFNARDVRVEWGWVAPAVDTIKSFFADTLGIAEANLRPGPRDENAGLLTLDDAWFRFTVKSSGRTVTLRATEALLPEEFFEGTVTANNRIEASGVLPFCGGFEVRTGRRATVDDVFTSNLLKVSGRELGENLANYLPSLDAGERLTQEAGVLAEKAQSAFDDVVSFRAAQLIALKQGGELVPEKLEVRLSPGHGSNPDEPLEFWRRLGVQSVSIDPGLKVDSELELMRVVARGGEETLEFVETDDMGRRDYMDTLPYLMFWEKRANPNNASSVRSRSLQSLPVSPACACSEKLPGGRALSSCHHEEGSSGSSGGRMVARHAPTGNVVDDIIHRGRDTLEAIVNRLSAVPSVGLFQVKEWWAAPQSPGEEPRLVVAAPEDAVSTVAADWSITQDKADEKGMISVTIKTTLSIPDELKSIWAKGKGFLKGIKLIDCKKASEQRSVQTAKGAVLADYTVTFKGETNDVANAAITDIRYTTGEDDLVKKVINLPDGGIKLSEMRPAGGGSGVKQEPSGNSGCNAGFASLPALLGAALCLLRRRG
ncbi:MAG: hypothetical protein GX256_06765 [Fretibacterium sp.]|nr:hypothetical protein [Fretibacterium sp.]